eukprot:350288-Chlamydomonas_euryale.AAC.5
MPPACAQRDMQQAHQCLSGQAHGCDCCDCYTSTCTFAKRTDPETCQALFSPHSHATCLFLVQEKAHNYESCEEFELLDSLAHGSLSMLLKVCSRVDRLVEHICFQEPSRLGRAQIQTVVELADL